MCKLRSSLRNDVSGLALDNYAGMPDILSMICLSMVEVVSQ